MNAIMLRDCKEGDWVYYGVGILAQVRKSDWSEKFVLDTGAYEIGGCMNEMVYPLSISSKIIADNIQYYYKRMCGYKLIKGSTLTNFLRKKFDELMSLDDDAPPKDFYKIYDSIEKVINELRINSIHLTCILQ